MKNKVYTTVNALNLVLVVIRLVKELRGKPKK